MAWSPGVRPYIIHLQKSHLKQITPNSSFSDVRVYTYVDITSARTPCHRIVLVPLSPNGERSIKRGLGWVGGGFKCWRMIQRGHISVMRDVLGFYKLQIWRGVCRRKALLLSDESFRRHIYIRNEHIVWVSCRRFMSWIVIDSSNLCLPLYVAADWKFTDNYYLEIIIDIPHYVFPSLCIFSWVAFLGSVGCVVGRGGSKPSTDSNTLITLQLLLGGTL